MYNRFLLFSLLISTNLLGFYTHLSAQAYTSYFTGNPVSANTVPAGGICLMGGATEHDEAMRWFLRRASGGDILVLRASGADGYNAYLYSQLGVSVNSVETIVFNNGSAAFDSYVQGRIDKAEGIWFAGGDQWNYVNYWRGTPIDSLVRIAVQQRRVVIGGTSAGMAIQGQFYFSAENGTISSSTALQNPYTATATVDSVNFIGNRILARTITDTHYDNPDRRGRQVSFLARIYQDWGIEARGIACDEYTAVCIDTTGIATVYGDYPSNDDNAYFLQLNCEVTPRGPETCAAGMALDWRRDSAAVRVYRVKGTPAGQHSFDLNDWQTGSGGTWENWWVENGALQASGGLPIACPALGADAHTDAQVTVHPNPSADGRFRVQAEGLALEEVVVMDVQGRVLLRQTARTGVVALDLSGCAAGWYVLVARHTGGVVVQRLAIQ
jgi:cyanophycinase-like exopeptidase